MGSLLRATSVECLRTLDIHPLCFQPAFPFCQHNMKLCHILHV